MNWNPIDSTSNNTNTNTNYRKTSFLTLAIMCSLMFSLILSSNIMAVDTDRSVLVFAQGNETETETNNDLQKQNDFPIDALSNNNDEKKTAVGKILDRPSTENCGINPNAPPCCTPGEDKGCMSTSVDGITISNFNTIPQKVRSQDEFKVQVKVTNNLNMPITYRGDMCGGSPLDIQFDNNVYVYNAIACQAISTDTLNANQSATVEGKGYEILRALSQGNVNAKITFNYDVQNGDTQEKQATKSFSFLIE
ncbi:MAG TPA: hypothetical protein VJU13_12085 [Candidatus Nitrosocosmicus sp.]|nr:hypothetical protein [Candidatus Nitrosocosmicus sp.]